MAGHESPGSRGRGDGMAYQVTLIPGDGIGPRSRTAARRVIDATGVPIAWEVREAGLTALESQGDVLPEETLASLKRNTVGLKGPDDDPDRQRIPQRQRRAAASARPLRQSASRQVAQGRAERLSRHRPGGGAREPGGDVHRDRVRHRHRRGGRGDRGDQRPLQQADRTKRGALDQGDHPGRVAPHRRVCLRVRPGERPQDKSRPCTRRTS